MGTSASYSDPDVSSSEHSVDTVIHIKSRLPTQAELIYRENYHHERSPGHAIPVQAMSEFTLLTTCMTAHDGETSGRQF